MIVEIGNEEQKKIIQDELNIINTVALTMNIDKIINKIIVAEDFDETVREIGKNPNYNAYHGHTAIAKRVSTEEGSVIVLDSFLYTSASDIYIRLQTAFHELWHVFSDINKKDAPDDFSIVEKWLYRDMGIMADEYSANRFSYELLENILCEGKISLMYDNHICDGFKGHLETITNKSIFLQIQNRINSFRYHGSIKRYIVDIKDQYDMVSKSLAYYVSIYDHYFKEDSEKGMSLNSKEEYVSVAKYLRCKYENKDFDYSDSIEIMKKYIKLFGIESRPEIKADYIRICDI